MSLFSKRLIAIRQESGARQTDIAQAAGISVRAYQYYEKAEKEPTLSVLLAIANYFDVPLDFLAGRPPYEHWEAVSAHKDAIVDFAVHRLGVDAQLLESAAPAQFIRLFGALFARAEIDPDTGALALYPLFGADERM